MLKLTTLLFLAALLVLSGCSSTHNKIDVPDNLYLASHEEPDDGFGYKVYLLFIDNSHFTWWRTTEDTNTVLQRLNYYLNEHPGTKDLTDFTRTGSLIEGKRIFTYSGNKNFKNHLFIQTFSGTLKDSRLTLNLREWREYENGEKTEPISKVWNMRLVKPN